MKSADLAGKLQHNGNFINLVLLLMLWPGCTMTSACHEPHFHILNNVFRKTSPFYPFEPFFIDVGGGMLLSRLFWWHPPKFLIFFQHLNHQEHEQYKGLVLKRVFEKNVLYPMVCNKAGTVMSKSLLNDWMSHWGRCKRTVSIKYVFSWFSFLLLFLEDVTSVSIL